MSKPRTPQYHRGARENAGVIMPQFLLHAALQDLPHKLRDGIYANDARQERLVQTLSYKLMDQCFHRLQKRPPTVSLNFPVEPMQLPMLTIVRESLTEEAPLLAHDAGPIDQDINTMEDVVLTASATGGETTFNIPCVGNPIPSTIELLRTPTSGFAEELFYTYQDFNVDIDRKQLTLTDALQAGDALKITRAAARGLAGGDLHAVNFHFSCVIFIEAENPIVVSVLEALVWRELQLKHEALITEGLVDIDFGFRQLSQWTQIIPAIGFRSEMVVTGMVSWLAFDALGAGTRLVTKPEYLPDSVESIGARTAPDEEASIEHVTITIDGTVGTTAPGQDIGELVMHSDLVFWDTGSEE